MNNVIERGPLIQGGIEAPSGLGIRGIFRVAIFIVVALASFALALISFTNVTNGELRKAETSVRSEINYLCLQLESLDNRMGATGQMDNAAGEGAQGLRFRDSAGGEGLSDPVGDVLEGYTLAETGTVVIISDGAVVASDDARVPAGSDASDVLGGEILKAVDESLASGQMQSVPYRGVFDEAAGAEAYGKNDEQAYLLAGKQGVYTVAIIEPESMVFRDRNAVMARETVVGLVLLIVVSIIVDRLLSFVVARRIDKTNEALERITAGDLETRVEGKGTREFMSLANGINATVEALQGWIAEAEMRMQSELTAARAIQESVLPRTFPPYPEISKFDVYAIMNAAREVGGDFYDFFLIGDSGPDSGKLAFLIADVSGKGVPAALFMMEAKAQVRRELLSGLELGQAVENVNAELADGNDACMFVTMWVGVLDYETGRVDYVNAGHNPPLLWSEGAGWSWLKERSGLPLGLIDGASYGAYTLDCQVGDRFLLYTDGVTEAMSEEGELYGDDRLQAVVGENADCRPETLVGAVRSDVASFAEGAEQSDDITILSLEIGLRA